MRNNRSLTATALIAALAGVAGIAAIDGDELPLDKTPKPPRDDAARLAAAQLKRERKARKRAKYLRQP